MGEVEFQYPEALVSTEWLGENLSDPALRIFDCTTYLDYQTGDERPYTPVSGRADYDTGHIPNSAFLDVQGALSDETSPYLFTMLAAGELAERFAAHGIGDGTRVVLYARQNMQWASRVWWTLRSVGFDDAAILDGGWDKWHAEGRPSSTEPRTYRRARFVARPRPEVFVGKEAVLDAIGDAGICTINALTADMHSGESARYGRPGRVPGSVNLPALDFQAPRTRELPAPRDVVEAFAHVGADKSKRMVVYCGGGIAATLDAFLLHQLGYEDIAVYDNSMSEWAKDEALPIETD